MEKIKYLELTGTLLYICTYKQGQTCNYFSVTTAYLAFMLLIVVCPNDCVSPSKNFLHKRQNKDTTLWNHTSGP